MDHHAFQILLYICIFISPVFSTSRLDFNLPRSSTDLQESAPEPELSPIDWEKCSTVPAVSSSPTSSVSSSPAPAVLRSPVPAISSSPASAVSSSPAPAVLRSPVPAVSSSPALAISSSPALAVSNSPDPSASSPHLLGSEPDNSDVPTDVLREVKLICNGTDYPQLCISAIIPLIKDKYDVLSVLKISIEAGMQASQVALSRAQNLVTDLGNPRATVSVLKDCREFYDTAVYNYEEAMNALPMGDIGRMNSMLSAVITNMGDCDDEFSDEAGEQSPLTEFGDRVTKMTSNCLAIISQLH